MRCRLPPPQAPISPLPARFNSPLSLHVLAKMMQGNCLRQRQQAEVVLGRSGAETHPASGVV